MGIGSLTQVSSGFGLNKVTRWITNLVKTLPGIKQLSRLDAEDFHVILPTSLECEIVDLQRKLLSWLKAHPDLDLNQKFTEILHDISLTSSLRIIRKQIEALKGAHGGQVPHRLQLLMSVIKAPEMKNTVPDTFIEQVDLITGYYLERLVTGSVALSKPA